MRIVFRNGIIYKGRHAAEFEVCQSMVVNDGLIEYLGNDPNQRIPELNDGKISHSEIDLHGRTVFPSFIDSHMHLLQFGASVVKVGLDDCKDLQDIRNTISKAAKTMPNAKRILCRGWRQSSTNREALASMIDDIDPRPIFIDADDLHSEWCNSAALKEMGVTRDTPDPPGGSIQRDENGNPTGLISEGAVLTLIWPFLIGLMSKEEKLDCIRTAIQHYHAAGYTGVVEMAMDEGSWELLEILDGEDQLPMRVAAHWLMKPSDSEAEILAQVQRAIDLHTKRNLKNSPGLRIAGIKVILDGVIDSCTAALSQPYLVPPYGLGELVWSSSDLAMMAKKADDAHLQIAMHAIGDAAVRLAVDTLETLGTSGRRHRIEHLEVTHPDDAKRLGHLGITASVQPMHSDPSILKAWPEIIGSERCDWAFAHRDFHENGAQLAFGTDSPTAPHMPFPALYVANTRTSARSVHDHWKINDRKGLALNTILNAATWGAAYSCFAERITGSLEVGKKADFIVVDGLPNAFGAKSLLKAEVAETWMEGRKVYAR